MASPLNLTSLLNITSIRWPQAGDTPFKAAERLRDNTYIKPSAYHRFYDIMNGYKLAADKLIDVAQNNALERSQLVFPILFSYRHYIELRLKDILASYGRHAGVKADLKTHDLAKLWESYLKIATYFQECYESDEYAGEIIRGFVSVDQMSFAFRYSTDKHDDPIQIDITGFDLIELRDVMSRLDGYFDGCIGYWYEIIQPKP